MPVRSQGIGLRNRARSDWAPSTPWLPLPSAPMGNAVAKHVERAEKTGVFALREQGLTEVPERLWKIRTLRTLDLSQNKLARLPDAVGHLAMLQRLFVDGNRLKALPTIVCTLAKLEHLSAAHNQITTLPDAIGSLRKLKKLQAGHNHLTELPGSLGACSELTTLEVGHNQISSLPESFGHLASLVQCDLSFNLLSSPLPANLGGLRRLKELDLRGNVPILTLPVELLRDTPLQARLSPHPLVHLGARGARSATCVDSTPTPTLAASQALKVEPHLIGNDGLLLGMDGSDAYIARRKARIEKELAGKATGGDMSLSGA